MLEIGRADGVPVLLSNYERARHIHILGATGTGKSKLLEHLIRQDIAAGRGLCLLDPHGTLAEKIEHWCATRSLGKSRRIHVLRPGDPAYTPAFNPLRRMPGEELSVRVDAMLDACARAWGINDLLQTPRLEKVLRATFHALAFHDLTLAEGPALLQIGDPDKVRARLTANLPDSMQRTVWQELNSLREKDFAEQVESSITRLAKFLSAPAMRAVVGQQEQTLDFRAAMDRSEIVIINLGLRTSFSYENARVLGSLLISDLFLTALGRTEKLGKKRPFSLYIDECYDFLSGDVERILDQTRKFGLHAVLAHQRLGQLQERGAGVYNAVMGSARTKIVFGGLSDDDAGIMARELMRQEIDLEKPKESITTPIVVGEEVVSLSSESSSESNTSSYSSGMHYAEGAGANVSQSFVEGEHDNPRVVTTESSVETQVSGASFSEGRATTTSYSRGRSETLRSIREERPTAFHSLEESLHLAQARLRALPDRTAIVRRQGGQVIEMMLVEVKEMLPLPMTAKRFRENVVAKSPYLVDAKLALASMEARSARIRARDASPEPSFWQEEG